TEKSGLENLKHEGIDANRVHFVGNTMIDSVFKYIDTARKKFEDLKSSYSIERGRFALVTLHRPSNVDDRANLKLLLDLFARVKEFYPRLLFPVHPRTRKRIEEFGFSDLVESNSALQLIDPVGYLDFLALQDAAGIVLTDSGGVQEET